MESGVMVGSVGLAVVAFWAVVTYNGFVRKRNRARTAMSSIDVNLMKRHDLIPNLVGAVRGAMKHEAATLESVTRLRARALETPADDPARPGLERRIGGLLGAINARIEGYPDLKTSHNVLHLQRTLTEIEAQIAAARRAYNASVEAFNNAALMFPSRLIAAAMRLSEMSFFEAVEADRVPPTVDLTGEPAAR